MMVSPRPEWSLQGCNKNTKVLNCGLLRCFIIFYIIIFLKRIWSYIINVLCSLPLVALLISIFRRGVQGCLSVSIVSPTFSPGERGGSVVECRTPEREVRGSKPTAAVLCPWARHFTPRKYWLITQEAMAPSRHDWKIVDWDVKPQHNQPTFSPLPPSPLSLPLSLPAALPAPPSFRGGCSVFLPRQEVYYAYQYVLPISKYHTGQCKSTGGY